MKCDLGDSVMRLVYYWWFPTGDKNKRSFELGIAALILFIILGAFLAQLFVSYVTAFSTGWKQTIDMVADTSQSVLSNFTNYTFLHLDQLYSTGKSLIDWITQILTNPVAVLALCGLSLAVYIIANSKTESR